MTIKAKWDGKCAFCGHVISAGKDCEYDPATKKLYHTCCTKHIKGVNLFAKTGDYSVGIARGFEYTIALEENRHGKFVVHMFVNECGGTFRHSAGHNVSTPADLETAEKHYAKALAFAHSKGAVERN